MVAWLANAAWAWDPGEATTLAAGPTVAVAAADGWAAWTGPGGTFVYRDGAARVAEPAAALAADDVDADGRADLLVCGPHGLSAVDLATGRVTALDGAPCAAVAADADVLALVAADGVKRRVGKSAFEVLAPAPAGDVALAALDGRVAWAVRGGNEVVESSARGTSTFAAGGAIGDVRAWDGRFAWSLADGDAIADASGARAPVAPLPGRSAVADLGAGPAWMTTHGERRLGVTDASGERVFAAPGPVRDLAAADLTGDRCADLLLATDVGAVQIAGVCAAPALATLPAPPAIPTVPPPRRFRFDACTAMAGIAVGGSYATDWDTVGQSPFTPSVSPALALACEGRGAFRLYGGLDSALTFRYGMRDDVDGAHVLGVSGGFFVGGERFRIGPVGTIGTVILGTGARAVWLPLGGDGKARRGFEARALALGPTGSEVPAFEVMVMYGVELREFR